MTYAAPDLVQVGPATKIVLGLSQPVIYDSPTSDKTAFEDEPLVGLDE